MCVIRSYNCPKSIDELQMYDNKLKAIEPAVHCDCVYMLNPNTYEHKPL